MILILLLMTFIIMNIVCEGKLLIQMKKESKVNVSGSPAWSFCQVITGTDMTTK